jgi:hypothetical protein
MSKNICKDDGNEDVKGGFPSKFVRAVFDYGVLISCLLICFVIGNCIFESNTFSNSVKDAIVSHDAKKLNGLIWDSSKSNSSYFTDVEVGEKIIEVFSQSDDSLPYLKKYWTAYGRALEEVKSSNRGYRRNDSLMEIALFNGEADHQMKILEYAVSQIDEERILNHRLEEVLKAKDMVLAKFYAEHGANPKNSSVVKELMEFMVKGNDLEGVNFLVEHGADIHYSDDEPLRTAQRLGLKEMSEYIKNSPIHDVCTDDNGKFQSDGTSVRRGKPI